MLHVWLRLFQECTAADGAGINAAGTVQLLGHVPFHNCTAAKSGAAVSAGGPVDVQNMSIETQGHAGAPVDAICSSDTIRVGSLDCWKSRGCMLRGLSPTITLLQCARGEGFFNETSTTGCTRCPVKHTRLAPKAIGCTPCPNLATFVCKQGDPEGNSAVCQNPALDRMFHETATRGSLNLTKHCCAARKIVCEPDELGVPPGTMVPGLRDCSFLGLDFQGSSFRLGTAWWLGVLTSRHERQSRTVNLTRRVLGLMTARKTILILAQ